MLGRAIRIIAVGAVAAVLLGACGSNDDDGNENGSSGEGGATVDLAPLMDDAEGEAPEAIADDIEIVVTAARAALEDEDPSGLKSDEFNASDAAIDSYVAENCDSQKVDVTAVDYAFEGIPSTLSAGRVTFAFTNDGSPGHYAVMCFIPVGSTSFEEAQSAQGPPHAIEGMTAEITVE